MGLTHEQIQAQLTHDTSMGQIEWAANVSAVWSDIYVRVHQARLCQVCDLFVFIIDYSLLKQVQTNSIYIYL